MITLLAIDTSTDACSAALYRHGSYVELYEVAPREHSRRLLPMLEELIPGGNLRESGVDAIAYCSGPGSFTGLRIAASAVQGLAFAHDLPAIAVSTLATQARTAVRSGYAGNGEIVLSTLDAHMNEIYWALYRIEDDLPVCIQGPAVCAPADLTFAEDYTALTGIGSGLADIRVLPESVAQNLQAVHADLLPRARDIIPVAMALYQKGELQTAQQVLPVYVRDEVSWKKLGEQGKRV